MDQLGNRTVSHYLPILSSYSGSKVFSLVLKLDSRKLELGERKPRGFREWDTKTTTEDFFIGSYFSFFFEIPLKLYGKHQQILSPSEEKKKASELA